MKLNSVGRAMRTYCLLPPKLLYDPSSEVILHDVVVDKWTPGGPQSLVSKAKQVKSMTFFHSMTSTTSK
jgi:hypothetical protein